MLFRSKSISGMKSAEPAVAGNKVVKNAVIALDGVDASFTGNKGDTPTNVVVATKTPPTSKFIKLLKKFKYALPALMVLAAPVWILGGFASWGVGSPVGLNVC